MSFRTVAVALVVVFMLVVAITVMSGPIVEISDRFNETGDYDNEHFDGNQIISDMPGHWFNMGLIAIFGVMVWGTARVVRHELTRGGRL